MRKILLTLVVLLGFATPALAQATPAVTYPEDSPSVDKEQVMMIGVRRCDTTPSSSTSTAGDRASLCADANGNLYTTTVVRTPLGDAVADETANALKVLGVDSMGVTIADESAHDVAYGSLAPIGIGGYSSSIPCTATAADGRKSRLCLTREGAVWARFLDPCAGVAKVPVPINISTATTTQLIAASSGNYAYICSINIGPTGGAQNIALIEDDTAACASPTAGMAGGMTAASGWNLAAGGGLTLGNGLGTVARTAATNRYVCLISSASQQTSGVLMYALAP